MLRYVLSTHIVIFDVMLTIAVVNVRLCY